MSVNVKDLLPALPKLILVLALLASVAVLTISNVITANDAYGFLGLVIGATAVAGTIVLSGPQDNSYLIPHVVILLAVLAFAVILGAKGYFTGTEIVGIFTVLIGGGSLAVGSTTATPVAVPPKVQPMPTPGNPPAILTPVAPDLPAGTDPSTFSTA